MGTMGPVHFVIIVEASFVIKLYNSLEKDKIPVKDWDWWEKMGDG